MTKRAFTIVELLVVIVIIAVVASLIIPAAQSSIQKARDAKSASNLEQIGVALNAYASDHGNFYPLATGDVSYQPDSTDPATWPWQQQIEVYIGGNRKVFQSSNVPGMEYGFYLGSRAGLLESGEFAAVNRMRIAQMSRHILAGECIYWTGTESDADQDDYSQTPSFKPDGGKGRWTPLLFADGHVQRYDQFDATLMTARYEGVGEGNEYPWSP